MRRDVVISGVGPVSALGHGREAFWSGLVEGRCGLGELSVLDASGFRTGVGGQVPEFDIRQHVPKGYRKSTKVMARDIELAVLSGELAVRDAGIKTRDGGLAVEEGGYEMAGDRLGCHIGAGLIAAETEELARALASSADEDGWDLGAWGTIEPGGSGMNGLPPLWLLKYLPNMLACHVTIIHGATGPSNTILSSEASGLLCAIESARVIARGDADACLTGGAESKLNPMGLVRIGLSGRLADAPSGTDAGSVVRPFDVDAPGGLVGEGSGIVVMEAREHAVARGAGVLAEVRGFGAAMAPRPVNASFYGREPASEAERGPDLGLERAVRGALAKAGLEAGDVDAIVPLAHGSRRTDDPERGALAQVFGDRLGSIPAITLPPMLGNTMAGQGGLMLIAGALAIAEQKLPARLHAGKASGLDAGAAGSRDAELGHVLVCATGMGGQSAAVVLGRAG
ncbi:MAG: beta-ketoacyl synthase N-terminal-like domain-containing protein [Planctomycetota bacterium]